MRYTTTLALAGFLALCLVLDVANARNVIPDGEDAFFAGQNKAVTVPVKRISPRWYGGNVTGLTGTKGHRDRYDDFILADPS